MHRPAITAIILMSFTASAVLGLCAMVGDGMMHDGLCAGTGVNAVLCAANPVHVASLLVLFATVVVLSVALAVRPNLLPTSPGEVVRHRSHSVLRWSPVTGLQPLFSDGILNSRAF